MNRRNCRTLPMEIAGVLEKIHVGNCPNFFLTGAGADILEETGWGIVQYLEEKSLLPFRGGVKHFSIRLPYLTSAKERDIFMGRLRESVSIARDYYNRYVGIVLIAMSSRWNTSEDHHYLHDLLEYIQEHPWMRMVVLSPGENCEQLYTEFMGSGVWLRLEVKGQSAGQYVEEFSQMAGLEGFEVSQEAEELLGEYISYKIRHRAYDRGFSHMLLRQIVFDREIANDQGKVISGQDIRTRVKIQEPKRQIWFGTQTNE